MNGPFPRTSPWFLFPALWAVLFFPAPALLSQMFHPFNLSFVANMGFADETEEDGSGGWTDQGPYNDMRGFPTGRQEFLGVMFKVIDPDKNHGRSVVALAGRDRPGFPTEAAIDGEGQRAAVLYFLHTCAWGGTSPKTVVAEYEVLYQDGSKAVIPLRVGVEFTNWWGITRGQHCEVAWSKTREGVDRGVNLFAWKNPHPELAIERLTFRTRSRMPVPILLAVTAADKAVTLETPPEAVVTVDRQEWPVLALPPGDPPSFAVVLDALQDVPAGRHGPLRSGGGRLRFSDGTPARFWGVSGGSDLLQTEPDDMERIAVRMASYGCNLLRIAPCQKVAVPEKDPFTAPVLSPKEWQAIDQWVPLLKEKGIYLLLDPLPGTEFEFQDGQPTDQEGRKIPPSDWETLFWKAQEEAFRARVNPRTGDEYTREDAVLWGGDLVVPGTAVGKPQRKDDALRFDNRPAVLDPQEGFILDLVRARKLGDPYVASWSAAFPNGYSAERPLLAAGVAVVQGWDGCLALEKIGPRWGALSPDDLGTQPAVLAQFPAAALAFRRGDMREAKTEWVCPEEGSCPLLALAHRAGCRKGGPRRTDNSVSDNKQVDEKQKKVITETGQISWQGNIGLVQVNAPRFQAIIGFLSHRKLKNAVWNVESSNEFAALSAVSLTKEGIQRSAHILLTGVTRAVNEGMAFDEQRTRCFSTGKEPVRMEPLRTTVVLHRLKPEPALRIRALGLDGRPMKEAVKKRWVNNDLYLTWVPGAIYLEVQRP